EPGLVARGASGGGAAASDAAVHADHATTDRLIPLPPAPIADPTRVPGPTLVIASRDEPAAARIQQDYDRLPEPKRLVLLAGTAHAQHIFATHQASAPTAATTDFVAAH